MEFYQDVYKRQELYDDEYQVMAATIHYYVATLQSISVDFDDLDVYKRQIFNHTIFIVLSMICMILYECYWIRYFKGKHTLQDFYQSFLYIPVPGATLPIIAFVLLGIGQQSYLLIFSSIILGIGHIGIHLQHVKEM